MTTVLFVFIFPVCFNLEGDWVHIVEWSECWTYRGRLEEVIPCIYHMKILVFLSHSLERHV